MKRGVKSLSAAVDYTALIGQLLVSCHRTFAKRCPPKPEKQLLTGAEVDRKVLTHHATYAVGRVNVDKLKCDCQSVKL